MHSHLHLQMGKLRPCVRSKEAELQSSPGPHTPGSSGSSVKSTTGWRRIVESTWHEVGAQTHQVWRMRLSKGGTTRGSVRKDGFHCQGGKHSPVPAPTRWEARTSVRPPPSPPTPTTYTARATQGSLGSLGSLSAKRSRQPGGQSWKRPFQAPTNPTPG